MNKRKIVLLAAIVLLGGIYTLQLIFQNGQGTQNLVLEETPDSLKIVHPGGDSLTLIQEGEAWYIGDKTIEADKKQLETMIDAIKSIQILNRVSSNEDYTRYGLDEAKAIKIEAMLDGNVLRTLYLGNNAVSVQHSYIRIDNDKDIYLASGSLGTLFNKQSDDLKAPEPEPEEEAETLEDSKEQTEKQTTE